MAQNHNNTTLFDGYDLTRAKKVRFLAVAMDEYHRGCGNSPKLRALSDTRRDTIARLAIQMADDLPLATAIQDLLAADFRSDDDMITHGQILQQFVHVMPPAVRPAIKPVPTDPLPQKRVDKNPPGARAIVDPEFDMDFAKRGTPDKSKYKFKIDFELPNPYKNGVWDYCSTKYYDWLEHHPEPSWDSSASLSKLNQWRAQIFKRSFGLKRIPRGHWCVSEKNLIIEMMKKDLENSCCVRWKRLTNNYNRSMQGKVQTADEITISHSIRNNEALGEDRLAPWRSLVAIRAQTAKWDEAVKMEKEARAGETSEVESTDDEHEISDPDSDSDKIIAYNNKQTETKVKGNTQSAGAGKTKTTDKVKVVGKTKGAEKTKAISATKSAGKRKREIAERDEVDEDEEICSRPARRNR